jgi:hypothetical protein
MMRAVDAPADEAKFGDEKSVRLRVESPKPANAGKLGKGVDSLYLYLAEGVNFNRLASVAEGLRVGETARLFGVEFQRDKAYAKAYPVSLGQGLFLFYLNSSSMYVKVAALSFEMYGFEGTMMKLYELLSRLGAKQIEWAKSLRVSRIDIFCDFEFDKDFDDHRFKTRLRRRGVFVSGKNAEGKTYYFGSRGLFCVRLYVKSVEIERSGKTYLRPIWIQRGFTNKGLVWRLEFEYRRRRLETMFSNVTLGEISKNFDKLWAYGIERLTYMNESATHRNLYRQEVHPIWQELQNSMFREYAVPPEEVRFANAEYRRKRAIVWICSHAIAIDESYAQIPELLKQRYRISENDFARAMLNSRAQSPD